MQVQVSDMVKVLAYTDTDQFHHLTDIKVLTIKYADVMELVDVPDSKSGVGNYVPVRPRPSAFFFYTRAI